MFGLAGFAKIAWPDMAGVMVLPVLPGISLTTAVIAVRLFGIAELAISVGILFPRSRRASAAAVATLSLLFVGFALVRLLRGDSSKCGCFAGMLGVDSPEGSITLSTLALLGALAAMRINDESRPREKS